MINVQVKNERTPYYQSRNCLAKAFGSLILSGVRGSLQILISGCHSSSWHMFSLTRQLLSFFKPRPTTIDIQLDPASILFDPNNVMRTDLFLYFFNSWASLPPSDSTADDILSQFVVKTIIHSKIPESPEKEFLIIETVDRRGKTSLFILERTVSSHGLGLDSITADLTSSPLDKLDDSPATDQILGQNFVRTAKKWHAQIVQYLKPNDLTLFQLVFLACVVHKLYPKCSLPEEQSCFFAGLVYSAVEKQFGVCPLKNANETKDLVYIIDSHLSNNFFRWKGIMVHKFDPQQVSEVISMYKEAYPQRIVKVFYLFMIIQIQSPMTFNTDHEKSKRAIR